MCTRFVRFAARGVLPLVALMFLATLAAHAPAASPSELLEKAIYTEETVGDLDAAIKLYEQVIAEGEAGQHAAAQAQYRLALCYLKKDKQAEATAAFEKLIEDYPLETELLAEAKKHLPNKLQLLPAPWTDGEQLYMNMKLPTGMDIGTMIYMVDAAKHEGQDVWRCSARGHVTISAGSSYSNVLCDKDTFAPIVSHWKHELLGEADAVYNDASVEIKVVGKDDPITIDYTPPAFDNEQGVELFRRLPLAVGYKTSVLIIPILTATKLDLEINVPETETITVPAGTFECYKLVLPMLGQTFWISTDEHRYLVRFAAGGVTAELAKVEQHRPRDSQHFHGKGFSLTLPAGWHTYAPVDPSKKDETKVFLLEPSADVQADVGVRPLQSLNPEQQSSPKAWTESAIDDLKKRLSAFQVREPGLIDRKVGDRSATTMVADYTDNGKKMTMLGVAVFGQNSAANLRFTTEADDFERLRKEFDKIVDSFELE